MSAFAVSNEELRGSTPEAAAQVVQWVSFADSDIVPPASTWVFPTLGIMHHNKQVRFGTWGEAGPEIESEPTFWDWETDEGKDSRSVGAMQTKVATISMVQIKSC
jgi:hypothetical protein